MWRKVQSRKDKKINKSHDATRKAALNIYGTNFTFRSLTVYFYVCLKMGSWFIESCDKIPESNFWVNSRKSPFSPVQLNESHREIPEETRCNVQISIMVSTVRLVLVLEINCNLTVKIINSLMREKNQRETEGSKTSGKKIETLSVRRFMAIWDDPIWPRHLIQFQLDGIAQQVLLSNGICKWN